MTTQMKGRSIKEIAKELHDIKQNARDLIAAPSSITMLKDGTLSVGANRDTMLFKPNNWSHGQLGTFLDIPKPYYDRMREERPELLAKNVNEWMHSRPSDERRMLRTVSGKLRAFLSNKYARRDAYDLMNVLYPVLMENKMQVINAELTESRLYIKATHPNMRGAVKVGDEVEGGVIISTSDVGAGAVQVKPYSLRLLCSNGLIGETAIRQRHVGKKQGEESLIHILSDEALEADDKAFFLKARDVLIDAIKPERFQQQIDRYRDASDRKIVNPNLVEVVELAAKNVGVTQKWIKEDLVKQLLSGNEGAGLTQWGLANSFTALAKSDKLDYDTSIELETAGGKIVALNSKSWEQLAA